MGALLDAFLPITGWSSALATIVITAALDEQAELSTTAQLLAESFLDCGYYNPLVTVCCDDTRAIGYAITVPVQSPVQTPPPDTDCATIAVDTFFSSSSQAEATAMAVAAAARELDCIYYNALVEVSCETLSPEVFGPEAPNWPHLIDTAPVVPGGAPVVVDLRDMDLHEFAVVGLTARVQLIYYASTPAETVIAASQAEADAIAYQMALAQLNCFFPSDWLEVDCTTEFSAFTARADATTVEATLAEVTYEGITTAHNEVFLSTTEPVLLDEQKTVYVTSPTGAFISTIAQSDATDSAEQYAISLLECLWRSPGVTCACYEPVTPDQDVYFYDEIEMQAALDIAPGLIVFNAAKSANNHEIPAGSFVTPEFPGDPDSISAVDPWATAGLDDICLSYLSCVFCNVRIEPECTVIYRELNGVLDTVDLADIPDQTLPLTIPAEYADYTISPTFKAGLLPEIVCNTDPGSVGAQADSLARLKPGSADTICIYGNPETYVDCLTFLSQQGRESEFPELTEASKSRNVTVPANSFSAGGASEQDAITAAIDAATAYGLSLLQCEFGNDPLVGECPGDYDAELSSIEEVEAEEFKSPISKADANRQAQIYVDLGTVCAYVNDRLEEPCLPRERPRVTKATDNCGCRHTYRCKSGCPGGEIEILVEGEDHTICIDDELPVATPSSVVEQGVIVSYISTAAANAIAAGLLNIVPCQWCNREVTVKCCDTDVPRKIPSEDAILEVTVAECEFTTEIECAATEQAFLIAVAQLFCEYEFECVRARRPRIIEALDNCNVLHTFKCGAEVGGPEEPYGPEVEPILGCRAQQLPKCLWVNLPVDVYCDPPPPEADWAEEAVREIHIEEGIIEAETMCDATEQVFRIAVAQLVCLYEFPCVRARRPRIIEALDNCSVLHTFRCGAEVGGPEEPDGPLVDPIIGCRAQPPKCLWVNLPVDVYCAPPPPEADWAEDAVREIHIEEGIIEAETMCDATEQVFRIAVAQLVCLYEFGCVRDERPRIIKASDNCGDLHTFNCTYEPDGPDVDPVIGCRVDRPKCLWVNNPVSVECCGASVPGNIPSSYTATGGSTTQSESGSTTCRAPASTTVVTVGGEEQTVFSNSVQVVFIPAGEFIGSTMCDATEQAFRMAVAQLFCEYTNETQTARCELGVGDHYHPDAVVSATVEANTLVGCQSTAEYNKIARDMAMAQLSCLYGNDYVEDFGCLFNSRPRSMSAADNCGGIHEEECGIRPGDNEAYYGGILTSVAVDTVSSTTSTAAANVLAIGLLETLPKCSFLSKEINVNCENKGREHPDAVLSVNIPQGEVTGTTMCDATEQAFRMAVSKLQCLWTNEKQEVNYCPEGFQLVEGGEGIVEADTLIQCSTAVADAIALAMAKAQVQCEPALYGNAEVTRSECPDDDQSEDKRRWELEVSGLVREGEVQSTTQESADAIAESLVLLRTVCKPIRRENGTQTSTGKLCEERDLEVCTENGYVTIGGGSIVTYGWTQKETDDYALALAEAQEVCCPEIFYNTSVQGELSCGSEGYCVRHSIPAYNIPSWESIADATAIAQQIATAMSLCCPIVHYNTAITNGTKSCDEEGICVVGTVAADSIPSWTSVIDATAIAQGIANALTVCCSDVGGDALPECSSGDLIYYNGTAWTCFSCPGSMNMIYHNGESWSCIPDPGSGLHVLSAVGGVPSWIATEECDTLP
jgi:hypothetical protein